ncbi:MAG: S46 family peptidase [Halieaceae bacterium]|nr:S46 family peptidase [Halieaceae bacterium]
MKNVIQLISSLLALALVLAGCSDSPAPAEAPESPESMSADSGQTITEGMWQPHQLPQIADELKSLGLELDPASMTDLTEFPLNAIVSLGGCSASFVSPEGLVITNHHCAYGSISYNSTEENNILANGFLAENLADELPARPGSRVYVTVAMDEVTDRVKAGLTDQMDGRERYKAIEDAEKALVAECEKDEGHRCEVYSFYGGLNYYLIKQLAIRDVRIVYTPAESIGKFGGDIDNWMWPRHTGDFAFYRAYVDKDGQPADYSEDNVPFEPKHYLRVAKQGPKEDEFIMLAGYPGTTNRYRLATEVENRFAWYYPTMQTLLAEWSQTIADATADNKDAELKYASLVAGLNNYSKNFGGMLAGYARSDLLERKRELESSLQAWIAGDESREARYASTLADLQALIAERQATQERDLVLRYMDRSAMLSAARRLYRLSVENEKPDAEREPGYQERDLTRFTQSMQSIERNFEASVDQAIWTYFLKRYLALPEDQRIASFDAFLGDASSDEELEQKLTAMYAATSLSDTDARLALIGKDRSVFEDSDDPFIQLAVAIFDDMMAIEEKDKTRTGRFQVLRPQYMELLIAYYDELGRPVYPDANSSLRVTYGTVKGYTPPAGTIEAPADGNDGKDSYTAFTTLRGIDAKYTGEDPFDSPQRQLELIKDKAYGSYGDKTLDSVPVNFLGTLDITGGNSGSATMNGKGEFVGMVFDTTYESINSDWEFSANTRSIHVDVAYILWVMENIDGADKLLQELGVLDR